MLATSGLFAGKPLTTGATGKPAETRTFGASDALFDTGETTLTILM